MEKTSFNLSKLAIFLLLIGTMVATFGEAQLVVEEVVMEKSEMVPEEARVVADLPCLRHGDHCDGRLLPGCCQGSICYPLHPSPIAGPGICTRIEDLPSCLTTGSYCHNKILPDCCEGSFCAPFHPWFEGPGVCTQKQDMSISYY